jgi:hypothetical protein
MKNQGVKRKIILRILYKPLKRKNDLTWLCSGDFNEILFSCEKEGGHIREENCMQKFCIALEDCDLHDLSIVGDPFTWRNNHHPPNSFTKERLERAIANDPWRCMFPLVRVVNDDPRHLDYRFIIVDARVEKEKGMKPGVHTKI